MKIRGESTRIYGEEKALKSITLFLRRGGGETILRRETKKDHENVGGAESFRCILLSFKKNRRESRGGDDGQNKKAWSRMTFSRGGRKDLTLEADPLKGGGVPKSVSKLAFKVLTLFSGEWGVESPRKRRSSLP